MSVSIRISNKPVIVRLVITISVTLEIVRPPLCLSGEWTVEKSAPCVAATVASTLVVGICVVSATIIVAVARVAAAIIVVGIVLLGALLLVYGLVARMSVPTILLLSSFPAFLPTLLVTNSVVLVAPIVTPSKTLFLPRFTVGFCVSMGVFLAAFGQGTNRAKG